MKVRTKSELLEGLQECANSFDSIAQTLGEVDFKTLTQEEKEELEYKIFQLETLNSELICMESDLTVGRD